MLTYIQRAIVNKLDAQKGRFCTVTFRKADGTVRRALLQPAANKTHLAANPSESAQRATATRARNNPELYNYWDVEKRAWRCFNLGRVTRVAAGGRVYHTDQAISRVKIYERGDEPITSF